MGSEGLRRGSTALEPHGTAESGEERRGGSEGPGWRVHLLAATGFLLVAFLLFGLRVAVSDRPSYIGSAAGDPPLAMWMLRWWPHAIGEHLNPLFTRTAWAPGGINLAWTTNLAAAAVILSPATLWAGPLFAYNTAVVLALGLAGYSTFLLCFRVSQAVWPSVIGGLAFACSSYSVSETGAGHLNLLFVFPVPLAALVMFRHWRGEIAGGRTVAAVTGLFVLEFLLSAEVAVTATLSALLMLGAAAIARPRSARVLIGKARAPLLGLGVAALVLIPYAIALAAHPAPSKTFHVEAHSADLMNLVVPADVTIGGSLTGEMSDRVTGTFGANDAYFGLPILAIIVWFAVTRWGEPSTRLLVGVFAGGILLAMGPFLHVAGHRLVPLPWWALGRLPFLERVLPERLVLYASLAASVVLALWLRDRKGSIGAWALGIGAVLALLPNPGHPWATTQVTPGSLRPPGPLLAGHRVLLVGVDRGDAMAWQADADFAYELPNGYFGLLPPTADARFASRLLSGPPPPMPAAKLVRRLRRWGVDAVAVSGPDRSAWMEKLRADLGPPTRTPTLDVYLIARQ
jgi:hypothetical protein